MTKAPRLILSICMAVAPAGSFAVDEWRPAHNPYLIALTVGIGAWFGAIPMALDWDREWQPLPDQSRAV